MFSILTTDSYCSLLRTAMLKSKQGNLGQALTANGRQLLVYTTMYKEVNNRINIILNPIAYNCLQSHFRSVDQKDILSRFKVDAYTLRLYINGFLAYMSLPNVRQYIKDNFMVIHYLMLENSMLPMADINMYVDRVPSQINLSCMDMFALLNQCLPVSYRKVMPNDDDFDREPPFDN